MLFSDLFLQISQRIDKNRGKKSEERSNAELHFPTDVKSSLTTSCQLPVFEDLSVFEEVGRRRVIEDRKL